ncbi:MAG: bi-domain-containing oxidoreductase [Rhodospirillales bacterium]
MRQLLGTQSGVIVANMPVPSPEPYEVLVRNAFSVVSPGTELASQAQSVLTDANPLGRAVNTVRTMAHYTKLSIRHPEKAIRRVQRMARGTLLGKSGDEGLVARTDCDDQGWSLGYSCAGEVVAVGEGVTSFSVGDLVACAGTGKANHAEYVVVQQNLTAHVPAGLDLRLAAFTTLGAIAMQGVRRADPALGDTVAVIGLGLLGRLAVELLAAGGCCVIGYDPDETRAEGRVERGNVFLTSSLDQFNKRIAVASANNGADAVIIAAASDSDEPASLAVAIARRRGVISLLGDVRLSFERAEFYRKELDVHMSTSYGPGRYDPVYEKRGIDYPRAYVPWTAGRNMQAFLNFSSQGLIDVASLIDQEIDLEIAPSLYAGMLDEKPRPVGVLIRYPGGDAAGIVSKSLELTGQKARQKDAVGWALVGAGAFGISTLYPAFQNAETSAQCRAVVSSDAVRGGNFARAEGIANLCSSIDALTEIDDVQAVVIATRHDRHLEQVLKAWQAGKHVFVEKPLAINWDQLNKFCDTLDVQPPSRILMVDFNRRFSPAIQVLNECLSGRLSPILATYRVNAGYIDPSHWVQGVEGGGRNIGEACHMYDTLRYLVGAAPATVTAGALNDGAKRYARNDNFAATINFANGSIGNLIYSSAGPKSGLPKERLEVFCDGEAYVLDDFTSLVRCSDGQVLWQGTRDKGHIAAINAFLSAIANNGPAPVAIEEYVEVTALALQIEDCIYGRRDLTDDE